MDYTDALINQLAAENQRLITRNDELWQMIRQQFDYIQRNVKDSQRPAGQIPVIAGDSVKDLGDDTTLADALADSAVSFHDPPEIDDPMDRFVSPNWDPNWSNVTVEEQTERDFAERQEYLDAEASLADDSPNMLGNMGMG